MHTVQPCDTKKCSTALAETQVSENLSPFFFAERSLEAYTERWHKALQDDRCVSILLTLFAHSARNPSFALTASQIGRLTGLHHQVVRRLVRGDKHCKARLQGLVAWLTGKGRRGTRYWLSPEGAKIAELLAKGLQLGEATLRVLATDRLRRKIAHSVGIAHQNRTPSENNMPPYGGFYYVCGGAVASKPAKPKPIGCDELLNPLAEKLYRDFRIVAWVANDIVQRHSPETIEAAITLCERRNGQVFNKAGFVIYLLREGFAQAYAEARHRARCSEWDEDFAATTEALRKALEPYGICVDEEGYAVFPKGRLALPPDPDEAITLLRKLGLLRPEALRPADCAELSENISVPDQPDSEAETYQPLAPASEPDDSEHSKELAEPLPEPTCVVCQRCQGDHHPTLAKAQSNQLMPLFRLSEGFKHRFSLPEEGYICRGCYLSLCKQLTEEHGFDEDKIDTTKQSADGCPRCGSSGELQPFEPQPFTQPFVAADPELARWSGKALCEACRCYLRVREGKVLFSSAAKRTKLPEPNGGNQPTVGYVDTEAWLAEWAFR